MRVDLHCHSNASDGELAPRDVYALAAEREVELFALTDHDTVAGSLCLQAEIDAGDLPAGPRLVAGVEISCLWQGRELHVLGLHLDPRNTQLQTLLTIQAQRRHERAKGMLTALQRAGATGLEAALDSELGKSVPGRLHLARALVASGNAVDVRRAFRRWLKPLRPRPAANWVEMQDAITCIRGAGGSAVLAHPLSYPLSAGRRRQLVVDFAEAGGAALEMAVPGYDPGQTAMLVALANTSDLAASAGSDFHGPGQWRQVGLVPMLPPGVEPVWTAWQMT